MTKVRLSVEFAGIVLPVVRSEDGHDRIPFKPIVEVMGVDWMSQYRRVTEVGGRKPHEMQGLEKGANSDTCIGDNPYAGSEQNGLPYLNRRLGIKTENFPFGGQQREMLAIRLDRVAAYLNALNPDHIRAAGNDNAADFLETKHIEWDNVLHEYEAQRGIFAKQEDSTRSRRVRDFLAVTKEKRLASDATDKLRLEAMAQAMASELGVKVVQKIAAEEKGDTTGDLFTK